MAESAQTTLLPDSGKKNVLIINSYSDTLSWTHSQNTGILKKIRINDSRFDISIENMDWKAYPSSENLLHIYSHMKYKYINKNVDIILTTDDAALQFALMNRKELFNDAPIVFSGINQKGFEDLVKNDKNVTGVIEEVDPEGTIRAMLNVNKNLKNIYVIFDNSESGISTWELTKKSAQQIAPTVNLIPLNKGSYKNILEFIGQIEGDSAVLLTTYYMDETGSSVGFEQLSQMVGDTSKVPVYHLYDFGLGNGALGGSVLSGETQGELSGGMALRILNGEDILQMPVYNTKTAKYVFDYSTLEKYGINPELLPKECEFINRPLSIFDEYRNYVIAAVILVFILTCFIIILMVNLRRVKRIRKELSISHGELSKLYEDLTASEEELRMQYDELTEVQQSLTQSENKYRQLYEKMLNGYLVFEPIIDSEGHMQDIRFVEINSSFIDDINININNVSGKTWSEVLGFRNPDIPFYQEVVKTGKPIQFETYYAEGNVYYWVNAFKISDNQVGVVVDNITNYKLAIKEIRKLNEELEGRVEERTKELQYAVNQLEAFTYTVTHDLKSPLRAIESYIRIVFEDYGDNINREIMELLSSVVRISREMITMIEKLLEYSTASQARLSIEEINMEDKFLACFNELKAAYPDRKIEMIIETGLPNIYADKVLMKQAITNILSNAFKFTRGREQARITVGSTLTEDAYIFYIKDNGTGFDMNYSSKLFGIFQRLHTSDEYEGTGIGLVTIKNIIEKHGGKVWLEGEVGVGATIYFSIPYID